MKTTEIRATLPADINVLKELYPKAFPDEDLLPLLCDLLNEDAGVFSFTACEDGKVLGHVFFTLCSVNQTKDRVVLLGPIAVEPSRQKQGIGSALIRHGFEKVAQNGLSHVFVLGEPAYYGRFGFMPNDHVVPPHPIPEEWRSAWQSLRLVYGGPQPRGSLVVPKPWHRPELWVP